MGRIKGHYEWDNDDLVPGRKREGGLHQNLFDSEGNLKGNARFIPDDEHASEPLVITETVYVPAEHRRRSQEQEEFERAIARIAVHFVSIGITKAKPFAEQWWRERARPALDARRVKRHERRSIRNAQKMSHADEASQDIAEAPEQDRPSMSSAEAQARYLAALAARAYSDEQMRLIANANAVDGQGMEKLMQALAELPPAQVKSLIAAMATNPSLLSEETLAELASVLGRRALP